MLKRFLMLMVMALLALSVMSAAAQDSPISWSINASLPAKPLKAGDTFTVQLSARIEDGWHLYSLKQASVPGKARPTRITLPEGQPFELAGGIGAREPKTEFNEVAGIETEFWEGAVTFKLPLKVSLNAAAGKQKLQVKVTFQTCNDRLCLPVSTVIEELQVDVAANPAKPDPAKDKSEAAPDKAKPTDPPLPTKQTPAPPIAATAENTSTNPPPAVSNAAPDMDAQQPATIGGGLNPKSLLSFVWLAMVMGALSLLTPCVFPMVPITVSYFTSHAASSRKAAVRSALIYSVGIILTFTALGMLLAIVVGASGINQFAANPWVNLIIAAIFLGFALNLFGAYQIGVPAGLLTRLDKLTRREGGSQVIATLLMGLVFTLTSFTCTAPFVGTLLVAAAQGHWKWPLVGMLAFSTIFALPFFVLALLPQLLSRLPRSGGWLNSVKVAMGFLEVAAAMKFISNMDLVWHWGIFTREVVLAIWIAVALLLTFYLLGKFQLPHDSPVERTSPLRLIAAIVCLAMGFYLLTGLFGRRLGEIESFLPPATEGSVMAGGGGGGNFGELAWIINDYDKALEKARQQNKRVLIDFTGYTCTNCRWMETRMFPRAEVRSELEKYVRVALYTDGEGEIYQKHQQLQAAKFKTIALPLYAVVDLNGNLVTQPFAGLTRDPAEFVAFLRKGQEDTAAEVGMSKAQE